MQYHVIIIGSGPGGYVAAIRCGQLGLKTALIEKYPVLGGTCLNVGCIPSKAMLDSSEHYHNAAKNFAAHGINTQSLSVDLAAMVARKAGVVKKINGGVAYLMKKNKVDVLNGFASFVDAHTVNVATARGTQQLTGASIIIATGSKPSTLPGIAIDKQRIISSTEALVLKEIPKHLVIIGGGVIGVELGSVYARLGSKVSVVEYMPQILAGMDGTLATELRKSLAKQGLEFHTGHKVSAAQNTGAGVRVAATDKDGKEVAFEGDYCMMAVGRRPYTEGLNLAAAGITPDAKGCIPVTGHFQTTAPGVYAIGDVIEGPMLAHKASEEGVYVAEHIAGHNPYINYITLPGIVYTWPEAATVGFTEEELVGRDIAYSVGIFPMSAAGRAVASGDTDGMIKVIAQKETKHILGVHMVCARASDLIGEAAIAMEKKATTDDIIRVIHGHPTFYENFKEACLATKGRAVHI
ncbi:MAG: dihydrolipoyl dehydrogenase [Bacteroidetes bacterium]|nr:dihydrolipoyl dehydrogenase [Bacteroidota bacterium]